jgi:hypothetical protein
MPSRVKLFGGLAVLAGLAMVPLFGDPRNSPVTHPEWARMLLRALDMEDAVSRAATASQVFAILSWKNSLAYHGDGYATADAVTVRGDGEERYVVAEKGVGEVVYPLAVSRGGDYRLRARLAGLPEQPVSAAITRVGKSEPAGAFTLVPAAQTAWVDGGSTHLDPGAYSATVLLPPGTELHSIEVAPPCVAAIEPMGGWGPTEPLDTEDVAVTALQALDRESELPPAALPIEVLASEFQVDPRIDGTRPPGLAQVDGKAWSVAAAGQGLRVTIFLDVPESGLYTISMLGARGAGSSWLTDSCRKSVICGPSLPEAPAWHVVTTAPLTTGRHVINVVLSPGAAVQSIRAERKKATGADYVSTLARLGFDVGPKGPMPRARAVDAMRWLEGRAPVLLGSRCGDVLIASDQPLVATGLQTAQLAQPQQAPLGSGPGEPPLGTPLVPGPNPPSPATPTTLTPTTTPTIPPTTITPVTQPTPPAPTTTTTTTTTTTLTPPPTLPPTTVPTPIRMPSPPAPAGTSRPAARPGPRR